MKYLKMYSKPFKIATDSIKRRDTIICINRFLLLNMNKELPFWILFLSKKYLTQRGKIKKVNIIFSVSEGGSPNHCSPAPKV